MTSIIGLSGASGQDWYSWPVGTTASTKESLTDRFSQEPDLLATTLDAISNCDAQAHDRGASIAGVWMPSITEGQIVAHMWAGVIPDAQDTDLRSARRYERTIRDRGFDEETTVYSQLIQPFYAGDVEGLLVVETRAEGDGAEPYILARAIYFPVWTTDRVVFEAISSLDFLEGFILDVALMASSVTMTPSGTNETNKT
ncbi:MAG: hypothetical protein LBG99_03045 [Propionibacteriaceae bacterium]|jgi:hypothetical protein|nr:hypothetical protein [Propionibacteriaceae bacterium]